MTSELASALRTCSTSPNDVLAGGDDERQEEEEEGDMKRTAGARHLANATQTNRHFSAVFK